MSSVAIAPPTRELVLGRYRPVRPLGSGGSGSVWLAQDDRTGLDVALKIIPREGKAAARAEREAHAARRLRHERCVRAYDVGHDASHVYIAYEYVPGRTVREALRAGSLSDGDAIEIAAQVLDALAHAHRMGIVHRDVKPSNVLLEDTDGVSIRLLDFGLAQYDGADTLTAAGDVPGTLAYIAPERLAGADASPESDVWSVGVMLWEALAGRHPFWGLPLQQVARAIEAGAPPLATERRSLPRRMLVAVDGALTRDPSARPRASELATDLRSALRAGRPRETARTGDVRHAESEAPGRVLARRLVPVALAVVAAALGSTLLPFWPPVLVGAILVAAGAAAWVHPRLGLALALGAAVFPFGNVAAGAAVAYAALAAGWLGLFWRDARTGLLFVAGPLLGPLGLLPLLPLVVQPAAGAVRRGALAVLAVLSAALVAGIEGAGLPLASELTRSLGITPRTSPGGAASAVWSALLAQPALLGTVLAAAAAAALLERARRLSPLGVPAIGFLVIVGAVLAGAGIAATVACVLVWGALSAAAALRPS
ncbi:MAG TPA: serine/threonine-protein kinase [Gaiellaceae bacterium]|nr:serine/threonine-protein kinase [Gaiellaceae bacterium]